MRILVVGVNRMLTEIVTNALRREPGFDVVADLPLDVDPVAAVDEHAADAVIVGAAQLSLAQSWQDLLSERPHVNVVALLEHGRRIVVCRSLGNSSMEVLLEALRAGRYE